MRKSHAEMPREDREAIEIKAGEVQSEPVLRPEQSLPKSFAGDTQVRNHPA